MAKQKRTDTNPQLTAYSVRRIREWWPRKLKELARLGGMADSIPSQILAGDMGVGGITGPRLAKAFGFSNDNEFLVASFNSWMEERRDLPLTEAQSKTMQLALDLEQGSEPQIRSIFGYYNRKDLAYREQDATWWRDTLLAELKQDKTRVALDKRERREVRAAQAKIRKEKRRLEPSSEESKPEAEKPRLEVVRKPRRAG